jgi:hypothetical protein
MKRFLFEIWKCQILFVTYKSHASFKSLHRKRLFEVARNYRFFHQFLPRITLLSKLIPPKVQKYFQQFLFFLQGQLQHFFHLFHVMKV